MFSLFGINLHLSSGPFAPPPPQPTKKGPPPGRRLFVVSYFLEIEGGEGLTTEEFISCEPGKESHSPLLWETID